MTDTAQKRLNDDEREALMEAFHSWDHAHEVGVTCPKCVEFAYDFEPLVCELIAARLVGFTGELADTIRADALAPVVALAKGLIHPWDSVTGREILDAIEGK
jgi:hypothetical protein